MSDRDHRVLILGFANTGKTHYGAQLFGRLRQYGGQMELVSPPRDLTVFSEVFLRLEQGLLAEHTPTGTYAEVPPFVVVNQKGQQLKMAWPDYGGEQLKTLLDTRTITPDWEMRLKESDSWMLFLRPLILTKHEDVLKNQQAPLGQENEAKHDDLQWEENAKLIELIQILLYASKRSFERPIRSPRLAVVLSCWDELEESKEDMPPQMIFERYLPLFSQFIFANWQRDTIQVWGLSALGKVLSKTNPDKEYIEKGPADFGYLITPEGKRKTDLTCPLAWLLEGDR